MKNVFATTVCVLALTMGVSYAASRDTVRAEKATTTLLAKLGWSAGKAQPSRDAARAAKGAALAAERSGLGAASGGKSRH